MAREGEWGTLEICGEEINCGVNQPNIIMTSIQSSPRIPHSPDVKRRQRQPRERRKQLRDFYGLQQADSQQSTDNDPVLDDPSFDLTSYLQGLNEKPISELLRTENSLIKQIRILDGDRKALVYDNYGRMITASDTMKRIHTQLDPLSPRRDEFNVILSRLHATTEEDVRQDDATLSADDMLREWVRAGPKRVEMMMKKDKDGARDEIEDITKDIGCLDDEERVEMEGKLDVMREKLRQ